MAQRRKSEHAEPADPSRATPAEARDLLANALDLEPDAGVLRMAGERYIFAQPEIVVGIQKQLEQTVGASTKGVLYLAGEKSADARLHVVRAFGGALDASEDFASAAKRAMDALALTGWGRYELLGYDRESGALRVELENSAIAEAYGPSARPVCHLVAGWLAAFGRRLLGRELLCEETACKAQGRPRCEFVLSPMPSRSR
jgi:hypothetical protein